MEVCEFVSVLAEVEENVKRFKKYGVNEIDCFCPNEEIAIDYNGIWWHQEVFKGKDYHKNKAAAIKSLGFAHVVIWEDNWVANKEKILTELTYIIKTVQSGEALDPSLITLMPELADPKEELLAA
jgi:very-short-patch-repair endonuclease